MRGSARRRATVRTASVPAPVGGLNSRDSIANMDPKDAIVMDNWVPGTTSVSLRKGFVAHVTGFADPTETLMYYRAASTAKLFAASGTSFYDATAPGVVGAPVQTGLTNARWQSANFGTVGGQFLYAVNGADSARLYNGSTWTVITGVSTPAITGVATTLLKDVQVYARRLWFVEKNSFRVWYLPVDSIGGAASSIDLGPLFILGGSLQGMVTWSVSSEYGTISYAVFVSSEGEVVVYQGINPDSADGFTLAGTFRIGKPIGQRFYCRSGSDTILITEDGLIPLSKAVFINRQSQSDAISYKITNLINRDLETWKNIFGWQLALYPLGNKLICNSPRGTTTDTVQYVMNTITNSWCRYTGMPSYCWSLLNDEIYWGGENSVFKAEYGFNDNGAGISAEIEPAFSYFGGSGVQKMFTAVRPIIVANGDFKPLLNLQTDFEQTMLVSSPTLSLGINGSDWNTSSWDTTSWGDSARTAKKWQYIGGIGFTATVRMQSLTRDMSVDWQSIDYVYERGTGQY